ncbi:unnamed protein product [Peniophora sp. CBMAI 1063]|nr:unnamed protein product [Peniophora sp. CBMAI 1063]
MQVGKHGDAVACSSGRQARYPIQNGFYGANVTTSAGLRTWDDIRVALGEIAVPDPSKPLGNLVIHGVCSNARGYHSRPHFILPATQLPYLVNLTVDDCLSAFRYIVPKLSLGLPYLRNVDLTLVEEHASGVFNVDHELQLFYGWYKETLLDFIIHKQAQNISVTSIVAEYDHNNGDRSTSRYCHAILTIQWSDGTVWRLRYSSETANSAIDFALGQFWGDVRQRAVGSYGPTNVRWVVTSVREGSNRKEQVNFPGPLQWETCLRNVFRLPDGPVVYQTHRSARR